MGRHARSATGSPGRVVAGMIAVVLAAAAGIIGWSALRDPAPAAAPTSTASTPAAGGSGASTGAGSATSGCGTLAVAAAPGAVDVLVAQANALRAAGDCGTITVTATDPTAVVHAATTTGATVPQVWVADSPLWVSQVGADLTARKGPALRTGATLATSPVALAVPASLASPATTGAHPWLTTLSSVPLATADPDTSTPSALALAQAWQAVAKVPAATQAMGDAFFRLVRGAVPADRLFALAAAPAAQARAFPASEQAILTHNTAEPAAPLKALVPAEGPPLLTYQFVRVGTLAGDAAALADRFESRLAGAEGAKAFAAAGFRDATGATAGPAAVDGIPATLPAASLPPQQAFFTRIRSDWARVAQDFRLLTVVDVSGSMKRPVGTTTRIGLAAKAVASSVVQMTPTSQAGLWIFSTNLRPGGLDYRTLVPMGVLGDPRSPKSNGAGLVAAAQRMPGLVGGDTGLYDTIWAAYRVAQRSATSAQATTLVVITDGSNRDANGISEATLRSRLAAAVLPSKPVRFVVIAVGTEPDLTALGRITRSVGGRVVPLKSEADLVVAYSNALWGMDTRPTR